MVVKIHVGDFWAVTLCSDTVRCWCFKEPYCLHLHLHPEDGGNKILWNTGILCNAT